MMSDSSRAELVTKLYDLTRKGKIKWESSVRANRFVVHFPDSSVSIIQDSEIAQHPYIEITNSGKIVEAIFPQDLTAPNQDPQIWQNLTESLYSLARESALGVEKSIGHILTQLRSLENT